MANPSHQIPTESIYITTDQTAVFPLARKAVDEAGNGDYTISYGSEYAYAIYCLSDATVTVKGGVSTYKDIEIGDVVFEWSEEAEGTAIALSAGMTIYGRFREIAVTGTNAKVLAYI